MNTPNIDTIWGALQRIDTYYIDDDEVDLDSGFEIKVERIDGLWKYKVSLNAKGNGGCFFNLETASYSNPDDAILEASTFLNEDGFINSSAFGQSPDIFKLGP